MLKKRKIRLTLGFLFILRLSEIDSYQDNFAAIIGNNVIVGGKGEVELKKNIGSLTGLETDEFEIKNGEMSLKIKGKDLDWNKKSSENAYTIDFISYFSILCLIDL